MCGAICIAQELASLLWLRMRLTQLQAALTGVNLRHGGVRLIERGEGALHCRRKLRVPGAAVQRLHIQESNEPATCQPFRPCRVQRKPDWPR
jgi:hypothetical protein